MQDLVEQLLRRDLPRSGLRGQQQTVRNDLRERHLNILWHNIIPPLNIGDRLGHRGQGERRAGLAPRRIIG